MKSFERSVSYPTFVAMLLFIPAARAQSVGADLKQSVTGGFLYAVPIGSLNQENSAAGYSINYAYRPLNWLAVEVGFNQVVHPVGTIFNVSNGISFPINTKDQLYLIPFGPRFVWQPGQGRGSVSVGVGGAYLNHRYDQQAFSEFESNESGFGGQAVVSTDYALSDSGRYRLGLTARFYYINSSFRSGAGYTYHGTDRYFTIGTEFTFSFR